MAACGDIDYLKMPLEFTLIKIKGKLHDVYLLNIQVFAISKTLSFLGCSS